MTDEVKAPATEANAEAIAPQEPQEETTEQKLAKLEAEKENYRKAYLKAAEKNKADNGSETEEERTRRIAREVLAESRMNEIDKEKEALTAKALKENEELKAALRGKKNEPVAAVGTHNESTPVTDTSITPDQMAFFKAKGWTDKDIERYKQNLRSRPG